MSGNIKRKREMYSRTKFEYVGFVRWGSGRRSRENSPKNKEMNVLSLFDGMSCGQISLKELGIKVDNYYSSEIDVYAIKQTILNFPNTHFLGDVRKIDVRKLGEIDLVIGGSPCQGFSVNGKRLNFDDPRSVLFFEYVRILEDVRNQNPDVLFLLENVRMKKKYMGIITDYLGVYPLYMDSNLVSAQNRKRSYWTNIKTKQVGLFSDLYPDIDLPVDRKIYFSDIVDQEPLNPGVYLERLEKYRQCPDVKNYLEETKGEVVFSLNMERSDEGKRIRSRTGTNSYRHKKITVRKDKKIPCLQTSFTEDQIVYDTVGFRYLTVNECSRLQTIPEWYKWIVSKTQSVKMLGNGWTIELIKHLFSNINI